MKRRDFAAAMVLPLLGTSSARAKVPRVVVVSYGFEDAPISWDGRIAFESGLRERGWTPGSTIAVEYRWAENSSERVGTIVAELIRSPPDVIVARTSVAQEAVIRSTRSICRRHLPP